MNQQLIDYIVNHRNKSKNYLLGEQDAYIPIVEEDQIEYMLMNSHPLAELKNPNGTVYTVNGMRSPINHLTQACFKLKYLKHIPMNPRIAMKYLNGIWSISELVDNRVIYPFMLFINGLFIPWELIKIIINDEKYYVLVDTTNNINFSNIIKNIKYAQIVSLPEYFSYRVAKEGTLTFNKEKTVFMFNKDGEFNTDDIVYSFEAVGDHHIIFMHKTTSSPIDAEKIFDCSKGDVTNIKLGTNNVMLFSNKTLATGVKKNITKAYDIERETENGIVYCMDFITNNDDIEANPNIFIDSTLLSIDNKNEDIYDYILFANYEYTPTNDNIARLNLNGLQETLQNKDSYKDFGSWHRYIKYDFDPKKAADSLSNITSDLYIARLIENISLYNGWLFNDYYKTKSNICIEEYTGKYIRDCATNDGYTYISTHSDESSDEYIIVLVNGKLYSEYHMCIHTTGSFKLPVQSIKDNDTVEILRFKNANNKVYDIILEYSAYENIDTTIFNENKILFSRDTYDDYFEYPYDGLHHFPVEYKYNEENKNITLNNPNYYGKSLKLVDKNRFVYARYKLKSSPGEYTVDLGDKFMYCNDYKKYLVFYNRKRLTSDNYRLTLPVRSTTPFSKFEIYLTMPINEGDTLDIFYVPSMMNDVALVSEMNLSGDIVVDKSKLPYELTSELYSVWVNGRKIPASNILDVGASKESTNDNPKSLFRIISNENSTQNICITQHIPLDDDLFKYFDRDGNSAWDRITSNEIFDIEKLLGTPSGTITNNENDAYEGAVDIKSIMYELIREQYMMNPRIDTSEPFIYDYQDVDQTAIEGYDYDNNAILPTSDANTNDNLDNVLRVDL